MTSRSPAAIRDIFHCILSYLDPDFDFNSHPHWDPSAPSVRQALARLATTHSTFTQPALSVLWRSLPSDRPLKYLLCVVGIAKQLPREELWREPDWELCEAPETREAGWKKFQEYSSLVRKIVVDPFVRGGGVSPGELLRDTFWCKTSSILGDIPLLPRLEVITFASLECRCSIDMGALGFLNPSVQELNIRFDRIGEEEGSTRRTALSSCVLSAPNLMKLSVTVSCQCSVLDLDSLPQTHPCLRRLGVHAKIIPAYLTSVASLPDLEDLSIRLWGSVNTPVRFRRLRSLAISNYELDDASTLIAHVDVPQLRRFSMNSFHMDSANLRAALVPCLQPLATQFPFFTGFDWRCRQLCDRKYGYDGPRNPGVTLSELIEPLLSLPTLRDLSLDFSGTTVPFSFADFHRMAQAWPDLETFSIGGQDYVSGIEDDPVQYGDHESFASFARDCPHLRTLRIPRVKIEPSGHISVVPFLTPHHLRDLSVDTILCPEDPRWDASHLQQVFRDSIKHVFPFATVRLPSSLPTWTPLVL